MKKNSNNAQTLKSSDDCNKFSKSVSYETLVVGTATTGSDNRQTRRLFLSSADKTLTTVGTFSTFKNASKVVENILQRLPILKLVKVLGLLAVLFFSLISESRAEVSCIFSDGGKTVTISGSGNDVIAHSHYCNEKNSSSADSSWTFDANWRNSVTTANINRGISSVGALAFMNATNLSSVNISKDVVSLQHAAFAYAENLTNFYIEEGSKLKEIGKAALASTGLTEFVIPEGVETIGDSAFQDSNLKKVTLPSTLTVIDNLAFFNTDLESISIPDGVETIGNGAFRITNDLISVSIPGSVTYLGSEAFYLHGRKKQMELIVSDTLSSENVENWAVDAFSGSWEVIENIRCVGTDGENSLNEDRCIVALSRFLPDDDGNCQAKGLGCLKKIKKIGDTCVGKYFAENSNNGECISKEECIKSGEFVANIKERACTVMPIGCASYNRGCTKCKNENFKLNNGECDRLRWTPAEAAEVLHDDNTNSVTITFKK